MIKKISFKNSRNITLVGTLWEAPSSCIVIVAHGSGSNRFARGLFEKIAESLQKRNYNVLSFDFSGHGESADDILTLNKSVDDLTAAIEFAQEKGYTKIALLGHSLGGYSCLAAFSPAITTMVLLGALTGPVNWEWEESCTPEQLHDMRNLGYINAHVNDGLREVVKIDANLLIDIKAIDQERLIKKISAPILIIHGDSDQQEVDLLQVSEKALPLLTKDSVLEIIPGASHTFLDHTDHVIPLIINWYCSYFPLR